MRHGEPGADWPDGLPETAVDFSGGSAHAGYQRLRSEPYVIFKWESSFSANKVGNNSPKKKPSVMPLFIH